MTTVASELAELVATAREATESLADSDLRRLAPTLQCNKPGANRS